MSMATTNDITELRSHLFETLRALKDKDKPLEIERARAVSDVAQTIINTVKVEVDFVKATGAKGSGFIPLAAPDTTVVAERPGVRVTQHRLKG